MADQPQIQDLIDALAGQLAESITVRVLAQVKAEVLEGMRGETVVCFSEAEAADLMKCSPRTLSEIRKRGEIDSALSPSGRPVYLSRHLVEYLTRHELKGGRGKRGLSLAASR